MTLNQCDDIDAAFDSIVLVEDTLVTTGYKEGYKQGTEDGEKEGFLLGVDKGSQLGQEIGFYTGFCEAWLAHLTSTTPEEQAKNKRAITQLEKLSKSIESIPEINQKTVDVQVLLDEVRSRFKTICSMLNIKQELPNSDISW